MCRRILPAAVLFLSTVSSAREKPESWLQVKSPHFVVATDAGEKQGRRIADQFERMRSVFRALFPKLEIDPYSPIVVLAVRDDKDFRALEPVAYLAKGSLKLGGLFVRAPDKNYVLMKMDAEGEHPYATVYHEYTHLLLSRAAEWMPLWMNEGLAEFYQNTDIHEKYAEFGQPSADNLQWLRQNPLLPLAALFAVDQKSPYYHEENKGSVFYAESWALVHYIEIMDFREKAHRLTDYSALVAQNVDPVSAATRAFGDLKRLQYELDGYVRGANYSQFRLTTASDVDDSVFKTEPMTATQADAVRADFLVYSERIADAQALLDHVLQADPNNVSALETKGFLEFRQNHLEEAKKWYAQAVRLDSQSFLANYYFAAIAMATDAPSEREQVESSLRAAVRLNPSFAPAFDALAVCLGKQGKNLDDARMMSLTAISLDPSNIGYRINMANIYLAMQKAQKAIAVLRQAAKLATTPADTQAVGNLLTRVLEMADAQEQVAERARPTVTADDAGLASREPGSGTAAAPHREFVAKGPHRFVVGILKNVHCERSALDLTVDSSGKLVPVHVENYFKVAFSALGFKPIEVINPCRDLESRPAKVEYVESANPSDSAQLVAVELHK